MSTTDKQLLDALAGFVNDVKPFHSKLLGFTTEINFSDRVVLRVTENNEQELQLLSTFLLNAGPGDTLGLNSGGSLLLNN